MSDKSSKFPSKKHPGNLDKKSSSSEKQDVAEINTGTIQKRKSNFKAIKPNSLKNSSEIEETSNLIKFKNSHLGKSAPCVSHCGKSTKDYSMVALRRVNHHQTSQIRSPAVHRVSTSCLSPRSQSPISQSPIESPRMNSPSTNHHFQFMPFKRLSQNKVIDNSRRWSIVSLPSSSGYASTTPCSSNISSQCSSSERLHQLPHAPTNDELRVLNNRFSGSENICRPHPTIQKQQSHPLTQNLSSSAIHQPLRKCLHASQNSSFQKNYSPPPISVQSHANISSSHNNPHHNNHNNNNINNNNSNASEEATPHIERQRPSFFRPRSRSLSSPSRSPVSDSDPSTMNKLFKERFPRAREAMEAKLKDFINEYKTTATSNRNRDSQPIVRFVTNQIVEIARDCLHKSHSKQVLTSRYFGEMSDSLQRLLLETNEKSPEASAEIAKIIKKLILIISRPARLLECLEFDPEEFYKLLEATEDQMKGHVTADLPIYVITKLGINNRDPLAEITQEKPQHQQSSDKSDEIKGEKSDKSINVSDISTEKSDISIRDLPYDEKQQNVSIISISSSDNSSYLTSTPIKKPTNSTQESSIDKQLGPNENDYEIIKLISNGAYGSVYLVKHKQTRQRFALKKVNKNNLMLRNQVEQVFVERDILSFTDNPFVVTMYASFETRKHLCLVMEYVEGGDCASLLKNTGPLPSDMAKLYFAEMVLAVEYLHSYGIVHRDLKPDNLLITALGHIKLTDFGLSKMGLMSMTTHLYEGCVDNSETRQFSDKQIFGTPDYIAPEVILRQGYGKTIDYWSMGIILYEFLIGCVPFFGECAEELFSYVVNDASIEWPSDEDWHIDVEAKNLITGLLIQDPQERLGSQGPQEVKEHPYLNGIEWNSLLRYKAEFIPQLENEEDTSYFDSRLERYSHHEFDDSDTDDSPVLSSSFASYSPQYRKHCYNRNNNYGSDESNSSLNDSGKLALDIRNLNINPSKIKMPSTPVDSPFDEIGDCINSPDRAQAPSLFLRHQQIKNVYATADVMEQQQNQRIHKPFKMLNVIGTPDSDHSSDHDISPKIQRRRKNLIALHAEEKLNLPKLSISVDHDIQPSHSQLFPSTSTSGQMHSLSFGSHGPEKRVMKSASAVDLSLKISPHCVDKIVDNLRKDRTKLKLETNLFKPIENESNLECDNHSKPPNNNGGSSASSREVSPSRDGPTITNLKPPIILRRGPNGFGFVIQTIRVYFGDSDFYTMHHLVMSVNEMSPAFEAGLRPGDLITHINGESVQGLFHTQVLQLLLSSHEHVTIRATPLKNTSIQIGGRKRDPGQGKLARKNARPKKQKGSSDKKRRISLFRRISTKIANAEIQQMTSSGALSPITPSRSFQSFSKDVRPSPRLSLSPLDPFHQQVNISPQASSQSSSPSSSVPNTPTSNLNTTAPIYHQRPSSLHGLKHKLHTISGKSPSSSRRKSVCHIPLSPLARTPSPSSSGAPNSPTRSPSPLAFCLGHHVGASNLTQSYTPSGPSSSKAGNSKIQKTNSFKSVEKP